MLTSKQRAKLRALQPIETSSGRKSGIIDTLIKQTDVALTGGTGKNAVLENAPLSPKKRRPNLPKNPFRVVQVNGTPQWCLPQKTPMNLN